MNVLFTSLHSSASTACTAAQGEVTHSEKKSVWVEGLSKRLASSPLIICLENRIKGKYLLKEFPYQGESGDGKHHFEATVDKERAEQPQPVVPQVLERQLEDVSPADAAEVNLFCRPVRSAAQHQELWVKRRHQWWVVGVKSRHAERLCSGATGAILQ